MSQNTPNATAPPKPATHRALVLKLVFWALGMFCFAVFLLPPLYDVFCEITGLNGKYDNTGRVATTAWTDDTGAPRVDPLNRTITVQFIADTSTDVPWPFYPKIRSITTNLGRIHHIIFRLENPNNTAVTTQAIPSISPAQAIPYLKKTQCFCFEQQSLAPFEGKDMGLVFYIDPDLPEDVEAITLSYRLYDITSRIAPPKDSTISPENTTPKPKQQSAHARSKGGTSHV
ncbi:MAG: cytochrome c oxidase assembly protein [Gammaproteobacteria bacterium]